MRPTTEQRFWAKVEKTDACWLWKASVNGASGYGSFWDGSGRVVAHRFSYEQICGALPDGLQLDHLCRNRVCVNPAHLEPVTPSVNVQRGWDVLTHCPQGHERSPDNWDYHVRDGRVVRDCGPCRRQRSLARAGKPRSKAA